MSFHDAYGPLLTRSHRLAYRLLGDDDAAHDIASEALVRLYEHWDVLGDDPDHRTAWTLRVTRNLAIDTLRLRTREQPLSDRELTVVAAGSELVLRRAVLDAVRGLPDRQRQVISLRYLLDLNQADVAATLGVNPGTVATHVSRALATLRRALDVCPADSAVAPRREQRAMRITTIDQATGLIGTDQPIRTRITGRTQDKSGFTADIGIPAIYVGRGQRRPRWAPDGPDSLVGAEFDCVVIDVDAEHRPVVTDALTGDDAEELRRLRDRVRNLEVGQRFTGRVAVVLPFGAFVDFEGLRGLVHHSDFDPDRPLASGRETVVEVVETDPELARIRLRY